MLWLAVRVWSSLVDHTASGARLYSCTRADGKCSRSSRPSPQTPPEIWLCEVFTSLISNAGPSQASDPSSNKRGQLKRGHKAALAVFGSLILLSGALAFPAEAHAGFFSELFKLFTNTDVGERRAAFISETEAASNLAPILSATPNPEANLERKVPDLDIVQESALVAPANPIGTIQENQDQDRIFLYIVKPGDTPSDIAKSFNVTVSTIVWANGLANANSIRAGDQLIILPVSGVKHVVKKGDTIDTIAKKYKGDAAEILAFNGLAAGAKLAVGDELIIPDGELNIAKAPSSASTGKAYAGLPNLSGYFLRPIQGGRRSQGIHGRNGVDLANSCSSPIFASAEGAVLIVRDTGWNGGFGKYIVINHPNGTQTVYAHNSKNMVAQGEQVTQGQIIGLIGNTGNTRGATGCHVHFEIHGARNPF